MHIVLLFFFLAARTTMTAFWKEHSREATMEEMMLDSQANKLTQHELPEILSTLPCLNESNVLELGAGIGWDVWTITAIYPSRCLLKNWFLCFENAKRRTAGNWVFCIKVNIMHPHLLRSWPCFLFVCFIVVLWLSRDSDIHPHVSVQSLHQPPADQSQTRDSCGFHGELCGEKQGEQWSPQQRDIHSGWRHKAGYPQKQVGQIWSD